MQWDFLVQAVKFLFRFESMLQIQTEIFFMCCVGYWYALQKYNLIFVAFLARNHDRAVRQWSKRWMHVWMAVYCSKPQKTKRKNQQEKAMHDINLD